MLLLPLIISYLFEFSGLCLFFSWYSQHVFFDRYYMPLQRKTIINDLRMRTTKVLLGQIGDHVIKGLNNKKILNFEKHL